MVVELQCVYTNIVATKTKGQDKPLGLFTKLKHTNTRHFIDAKER